MKKFFGAFAVLLFWHPAWGAAGGQIAVDTYIPVIGSVSSTYSMRTDGLNWASGVVVMTSVTSPAVSFNDGQPSTGTFTVNTYAALSTSTASGTLTAVSTSVAIGTVGSGSVAVSSNVSGTQIAILGPPGALNFMVGGNVAQGYSSTSTAVNFAAAVNATTTNSNVTATVNASSTAVTIACVSSGTFCNSYSVTSTSPTAVSTAAFSGGANPVTVTIGGVNFVAAVTTAAANQFAVGTSTAAMMNNLAAVIIASSNTFGFTSTATLACMSSVSCGVLYATATVAGTAANSYGMVSSNYFAISTNTATMTGGTGNAVVTVNGVPLTANVQWYPMTSNAVTATNLATAITASSMTSGMYAGAVGAIVYASSTVNGTGTGYVITSSTNNALSIATLVSSNPVTAVATGVLTNGQNIGYGFFGKNLIVPNHKFVTGEDVWISTASAPQMTIQTATGTPVGTITALTPGVTYYAIVLDANDIGLATTQANAVAGTALLFVSSNSYSPADVFTVNAGPITGNPSGRWVVSNDNTNWVPLTTTPFNITISTVQFQGYFSSGAVTTADFGHMDWGWLGFTLNAPLTGAVNASVKVIGKQN
jgi:hypothetical protein